MECVLAVHGNCGLCRNDRPQCRGVKDMRQLMQKKKEQLVLFDQLRVWQEAMSQGINPDEVKAFGKNTEWFDMATAIHLGLMVERITCGVMLKLPQHVKTKMQEMNFFNYVKMKDGSTRRLNYPIKAAITIDSFSF